MSSWACVCGTGEHSEGTCEVVCVNIIMPVFLHYTATKCLHSCLMPASSCETKQQWLHTERTLTLSIVALPPFVSFFRFSVTSAFDGFLFSPVLLASLSFCLFSFSLIFRRFTIFLWRLSRFLSVDVFSVSPRISPALFFSFSYREVLLDMLCD